MTIETYEAIGKHIITLEQRLDAQTKTHGNAYADLDKRITKLSSDYGAHIDDYATQISALDRRLAVHAGVLADHNHYIERIAEECNLTIVERAMVRNEEPDETSYATPPGIKLIDLLNRLRAVERRLDTVEATLDFSAAKGQPRFHSPADDEVDVERWIEWAEEHKHDPLLQEFIKRSIRFDPI